MPPSLRSAHCNMAFVRAIDDKQAAASTFVVQSTMHFTNSSLKTLEVVRTFCLTLSCTGTCTL